MRFRVNTSRPATRPEADEDLTTFKISDSTEHRKCPYCHQSLSVPVATLFVRDVPASKGYIRLVAEDGHRIDVKIGRKAGRAIADVARKRAEITWEELEAILTGQQKESSE